MDGGKVFSIFIACNSAEDCHPLGSVYDFKLIDVADGPALKESLV